MSTESWQGADATTKNHRARWCRERGDRSSGTKVVLVRAAGQFAICVLLLTACSHDEPPRTASTSPPPAEATRVAQRVTAASDVVAVGIVKSQVGAEVKVGSQL